MDRFARPQLRLLSDEQIEKIHASALRILEKEGVRVDSPASLRLIEKRLGPSWIIGDRARLPAELISWALETAPSTVDIYDRRGNPAFRLGEGRTRFGIGVTTLWYQDPITDALEPFARRHMQQITRLGQLLPLFDVISTPGIVQDVPPDRSDLFGTLDIAANSTKPLVLLVSDENQFTNVLDLLEHLQGDLATHPWVIPYFNPVTPLIMNSGTLDKMDLAIQRGLPLIFSNYSMSGMSSPITPAGTLALLIAELLAGLVFSQLMREGAPVILGILPARFDMKTMVNFYDPQSMVLNLACSEMMGRYGIPHCGTSGSGTGLGPDLLAAETYWMNHLTAAMLHRGGIAPFVGDTLTSKAFSPTNTVYVHEIIDQAIRYANGFALDDEALVLDEIESIGPGGSFLTARSTLREYRRAYYNSPIFSRWSMEKWVAEGRPPAIDLLRKYTAALLDDLKAPDDGAEMLEKGEQFIRRL